MQRFQRFAEIDAPVELVFDRFSDFDSFPRWMRNVREVRRTGRKRTHWVCETATPELYAEWDAEITVFAPDRRVAWRSVRGDIRTDGEAVFTVTPYGTTLVRVVLGYETPLGRTGAASARFFGVHPGEQLAEDLEHFKRAVERETHERMGGRRERVQTFARASTRREERRPERVRPAQTRVVEDDASRRSRRSVAGGRQVSSESERGREDARRSDAVERVGDEYRPRYALTPRERERERGTEQRQFDPRVSEIFMRRGVDRLVADPPSRRWRERDRERERE